jgi:hypothetical protein
VKQIIVILIVTVALPAMAAVGDPNTASPASGVDWTDLMSFFLAAMGIAGLLIIRRQVSHL